mmetsp:Transcript_12228/g.27527  ORF Transcript_12228/g.27527 Transcript_12228/m.27527 type:complete len:298 (+) Transcript_12228:673-1566(+)
MSIFTWNCVVQRPQVGTRRHKQHVVVNVLVKINTGQTESSQLTWFGKRGQDIVCFRVRIVAHGRVASALFLFGVIGGNLHTFSGCKIGHNDILQHFAKVSFVKIALNTKHGSAKIRGSHAKVQVVPHTGVWVLFVNIKLQHFWATLRTGPKLGSAACDLIRREVVQQLSNLIVKQLFKGQSGPSDTILKGGGTFIDQSSTDKTKRLQFRVGLQGIHVLFCRRDQVGIDFLRCLLEFTFEPVAGPLQRVLDLVREIFERADGNRLFGWIPSCSIILGQVRHDDLRVSFRAQCAALQHG